MDENFNVGDLVTDLNNQAGEVRAVFTTRAGEIRYVVEHRIELHIYSAENLRKKERGPDKCDSCTYDPVQCLYECYKEWKLRHRV